MEFVPSRRDGKFVDILTRCKRVQPQLEPIRKRRQDMSGKQAGDPKKAAAAMLTLIEAENPPMHLLLGSDALRLVREKLDFLKSEFDAWEKLTLSTDFSAP